MKDRATELLTSAHVKEEEYVSRTMTQIQLRDVQGHLENLHTVMAM